MVFEGHILPVQISISISPCPFFISPAAFQPHQPSMAPYYTELSSACNTFIAVLCSEDDDYATLTQYTSNHPVMVQACHLDQLKPKGWLGMELMTFHSGQSPTNILRTPTSLTQNSASYTAGIRCPGRAVNARGFSCRPILMISSHQNMSTCPSISTRCIGFLQWQAITPIQ
jgi:hypothetical protein